MIQAQRNQPFQALVEGADTDIATYEVYDPANGDTIVAPSAVGLEEPREGTWVATLTIDTLGTFRIRWTDTDDDTTEEDLVVTPVSAITPSVSEVAALLRARTRDLQGFELEEFNEETRPSGTEVVGLILQAESHVRTRVATVVPAGFEQDARAVIAMRAANLVELGYFPEQTGDDRTVYQSLRLTYDEAAKQLGERLQWWSLGGLADEVMRLTSAATGGTFTFSLEGFGPTTDLPFDATADEVRLALEGLANVAPGDLTVSGGPFGQGPMLLQFATNFGGWRGRTVLDVDLSALTGGAILIELVRRRGC